MCQIRAGGDSLGVGGKVWNTLKWGGIEKEETGNKNFKKEGKLGQGVVALKMMETGTSLQTIILVFFANIRIRFKIVLSRSRKWKTVHLPFKNIKTPAK